MVVHIEETTLALEARLVEVLAHGRERSRAFSLPYVQLWESLERTVLGGKKIRPRLLLNAYAALGGTDRRAAIDAACAMELLHVALVIHDDVVDKDLMRRGEMNISGRFASEAMLRGASMSDAHAWGDASSLLAGDLMLTLSQSLLARLDIDEKRRTTALDIFDETVLVSAAGEHSDVWLSMHLEQAGPHDVLAMVEHKTAAYSFQAPLTLAAVLASGSAGVIDALSTIARHIGVIYQLRDDFLGVFGDERETGKSTLSDLREGKETLLISFARSDAAWAAVESLFGNAALSVAGGQQLRRVIEQSGALALVESLIADRCEQVHQLIREAALPTALKAQLTALTSSCNSRIS